VVRTAHPYYELNDVDREFWAERLDPYLPDRIYDAHRHITLAEHEGPPSPPKQQSRFPDEIAGPESLEQAALGYSELLPGRTVSYLAFGSPTQASHLEDNNAYLSEGLRDTDSAALALTSPAWSADKLREQLRQPRIIGIKPYQSLIPGYQGEEVGVFDFCPHHHLEVLNDLGAWLTLHIPRKERLADRNNLAEILEIRWRYPDLVLVIAHLGRSYAGGYARKGFPHLADDQGILFDTSAVLNPAVFALALDRLGPERLMFGTDHPVFYMRGRRRWEGDRYLNLTSGNYSWNVDRQPPEVEATYTLSLYEAVAACVDTMLGLGFGEAEMNALFHDNARRLVDRLLARKESW